MMVILPDTNETVAMRVAERLCERMQQAIIFADMRSALPHITGSFGVASLIPEQDDHALIAAADAALYRAKAGGRNRVML
jgi:diguanylate cyclase (GGDEF)-like protein